MLMQRLLGASNNDAVHRNPISTPTVVGAAYSDWDPPRMLPILVLHPPPLAPLAPLPPLAALAPPPHPSPPIGSEWSGVGGEGCRIGIGMGWGVRGGVGWGGGA